MPFVNTVHPAFSGSVVFSFSLCGFNSSPGRPMPLGNTSRVTPSR
ncbi:hypothetical protein E2C01_066761 [Portunus trituberculatus]|uniref:Uncharacterized protein n=1 Tax=Portunus trituberculatus TaxID=210409 RepID=A0A5B7HRU9_PORTR|nr:hypothetical protein [Portunus trituberculatus]